METLERRSLLAADLSLTDFSADGTNLLVTYTVSGEALPAFDIALYRSDDGVNPTGTLSTVRVTDGAKRSVGAGHVVTIAPNFSDVYGNYRILLKIDSASEISETSEANNQTALASGVFITAEGVVHVHGTTSADTGSVAQSSTVNVTLNGANYSHSAAAVAAIHVRLHGGADSFTAGSGVAKPLWIYGGEGADALYGGAGNDLLDGDGDSSAGYGGYGGYGNDTVYGGEGNDYLYGGDGADLLFGDNGNDVLEGGAGNDAAYGGYGDDVEHGGDGNDTLWGNEGNDSIYGDAGDDHLSSGMNSASYGGYGGYGDVVDGGAGNDYLYGDGGEDDLRGNDGNDTIVCGAADDVAQGGYGDDVLYGGYGSDILHGDEGNDTLYGDDGNDSLYGGAGNDLILGGTGADFIFGGSGIDEITAGGETGDTVGDKPVIASLSMTHDGYNMWTISGTILDDGSFANRRVYLTGLVTMSVEVGSDGGFTIHFDRETGTGGWLFANFTDDEGLAAVPRAYNVP